MVQYIHEFRSEGAAISTEETAQPTVGELRIEPVWQQVSDALREELVAFWQTHQAIVDPQRARARAALAVCVGRDVDGALCAVGTAIVRVLPRVRQPLYHYRQFIAPRYREASAITFSNRCKQVLEDHNATLEKPEALGVVFELPAQGPGLPAAFHNAYEAESDSTFIGYSPRTTQLRVCYFVDARLQTPPHVQARRAGLH